jgi:hypothetical protein
MATFQKHENERENEQARKREARGIKGGQARMA